MAVDLIEAVQQRLNLPGVQKIATVPDAAVNHLSLSQVALVCVAGALYKLTRTTKGCVDLLLSGKNDTWLNMEAAFGKRVPQVVEMVAGYGISDPLASEHLLRKIANACLLVMHETLAEEMGTEGVKNFMTAQRHSILMYVPAELPLEKIIDYPIMGEHAGWLTETEINNREPVLINANHGKNRMAR